MERDFVERDIDAIIARVQEALPGVRWQQLRVPQPIADDDGTWFMWIPGREGEVQLESTTGQCPFLLESDRTMERVECGTVDEVVERVLVWLASD